MHLRQFDLNLLLAFDALFAERNVTRAASRIALTQPAMSHALQRLRAAFGDPLFVRARGGMEPTQVAANLAPIVQDILCKANSLVDTDQTFRPEVSRRSFIIGMTDYAASRILPIITNELHRLAPLVRLTVRPLARGDGPAAIEAGDVDLAIGIFLNVQRLRRHLLEEEQLLCAVWKRNTSIKGRLSLSQYLSLQHVLVATRGDPGGLVEQALGKLGVQRSIFCIVPHGLVAPAIIKGTDLALTLAEGLLRDHEERFELKLLKPPIALPKVRLEMLWHKRLDRDTAMQWLREFIIAKSRQLSQQHTYKKNSKTS
jgi:DNA-binding transcriptional LysR family regulator